MFTSKSQVKDSLKGIGHRGDVNRPFSLKKSPVRILVRGIIHSFKEEISLAFGNLILSSIVQSTASVNAWIGDRTKVLSCRIRPFCK
jgi:hypothetical protein